MLTQKDLIPGSILELNDFSQVTVHNHHPNILFVVVSSQNKKSPYSIPITHIKQIISYPLPNIGDRVFDEDLQEGVVLSSSPTCITIEKENLITSHSFEKELPKIKLKQTTKSTRGGSRPNSGRKPSGHPPKKRKAIQLDQDIASKLPNLKMLADLIEEFRPFGESSALRCTKLSEFYKALYQLPRIS